MTRDRLPTVWVLTDGKAGDEQPLIGIAEAMGCTPALRRVSPRKPFALLMPFGPIDPRERSGKPGSPLAPPHPDICLATGRRTVSYLRALKKLSPSTFTVFFKDPRTANHGADLLVMQRHDRPDERDALVVTTAPNRISAEKLDAVRQAPPAPLAVLPHPRIAVLVGGDSRHHRFLQGDIDRLLAGLRDRIGDGASLMITASRRTPKALADALSDLAASDNVRFWNGAGENPLIAYIALADEIVVTADSTNMIGEAVASGRPVQVFYPTGGHAKIDSFLEALTKEATIGRFPEKTGGAAYAPVNSTPAIARTILERWRTNA